jgi:hypothetical protein
LIPRDDSVRASLIDHWDLAETDQMSLDVEAVSIDDYCTAARVSPDFVKIGMEGMELTTGVRGTAFYARLDMNVVLAHKDFAGDIPG